MRLLITENQRYRNTTQKMGFPIIVTLFSVVLLAQETLHSVAHWQVTLS